MLLVVMILGVLLIQKVPEKWFRFLFLACILLNVIYRIEFLPFALAGGVRLVCKGMELVLLIVACKVFDKVFSLFEYRCAFASFFGDLHDSS